MGIMTIKESSGDESHGIEGQGVVLNNIQWNGEEMIGGDWMGEERNSHSYSYSRRASAPNGKERY